MKSYLALIALFMMFFSTSGNAVTASAEVPNICGFMSKSDEWRDDGLAAYSHFGFYRFKADGSSSPAFSPLSPISPDNEWATNGGTYADDNYYCFAASGSWMRYTLTYRVISTRTWSVTRQVSFAYDNSDKESEESQKAYLVPSDMAYDPVSKTVYAAARRFNSQNDSYLCTLDTETGILTRVGTIPPMAALTAQPDGTLYGIGIDGMLYKIGADATCTEVGHTGYFPSTDINQSATTDYADGSIYWSLFGFASLNDRNYNINGINAMMKVNPATGAATVTWDYPRDEVFSSISILTAAPGSPADIADITFMPESFASSTGVVRFTAPTLTNTGKPLTGTLDVTIKLDDATTPTATATVEPGAQFEYKLEGIADGSHTVFVEVGTDGNFSSRAAATNYFGFDAPAKISDLKISAEGNVATVSWTAPSTGINGAPYPQENIRYTVTRHPDGKLLYRSLKTNTFTDNVEIPYTRVSYTITPYHTEYPDQPGTASTTERKMLGVDMELPYSNNINSQNDFNYFITIDADGNGSDDWNAPCWKYDEEYYCAFYYGSRGVTADDWLVTPPLKLDNNRLYKLSFKWYAYYGYGSHFKVATGAEPTVEALDNEILDVNQASTFYDRPGLEQSVIFSVRKGDRFIGIHHMSETMEHLSIDDILIEDCGDARVPAPANGITAVATDDGKVLLSFTAPEKDCAGNALTDKIVIKVFRGSDTEPAVTFSDVEAGKSLTWTDEEAAQAVNTYTIVTANSFGDGLPSTASCDLTPSAPVSVTGARARYINERQVEITWQPVTSEIGANGNPLDPANIRYLVYRVIPAQNYGEPTVYKVIGRDLTATRYVDDEPLYGREDTGTQQAVFYYVAAVNEAGESDATPTNEVIIGASQALPFTETWNYGSPSNSPWMRGGNGASWGPSFQGYDPLTPAQDGFGLLSLETDYGMPSGTGIIETPRLDLSTQDSPVLSLWVYHDPVYPENVSLSVALDIEGNPVPTFLPGTITAKSETKGWKEYTFDLSAYISTRASVMLVGYTVDGMRLHVDNLSVTGADVSSAIVRPLHLTGQAKATTGNESIYTLTMENIAGVPADNVTVTLSADGKELDSAAPVSVAAGKTSVAELTFVPDNASAGSTVTLEATVSAGGRTATVTKEVEVEAANPAFITDLAGSVADSKVTLTWSHPSATMNPAIVIDGFEAYRPFAIDGVGAWTLHDGDGLLPFTFSYGSSLITWENSDVPQSFMVFKPSAIDTSAPIATTNEGDHVLVCWGSPAGANNDWLISPELTADRQMISFYASAAKPGSSESFRVLVSSTDNNPDSFKCITGSNPVTVSDTWELYHYALPEGTRYFAINYVSDKQTGLLIDDIMFLGYHNAKSPDGYNIYRNGAKLNDMPVSELSFTDDAPDETSQHIYTVRAVYGNNEGADSNSITIGNSAIDNVSGAATEISIDGGYGIITVTGAYGLPVEVFNAAGMLIDRRSGENAMTLEAAPGVYIVKAGTATAKVVVR